MSEKVNSFRDLKVWQKGILIVSYTYGFSRDLPVEEKYGLVSQLRRAAFSIPANIAEGCARNNTGEFVLHIGYALGSLAELETGLVVSENEYGITVVREYAELMQETGRMLHGLRKSLQVNPRAKANAKKSTDN